VWSVGRGGGDDGSAHVVVATNGDGDDDGEEAAVRTNNRGEDEDDGPVVAIHDIILS
jgi:hypothetical protein